MNPSNISILVVIGVVLLFILFATIIRRYRRCPSDKILVVYGKTGGGSAKCIHGGGKFVWPVIQDYAYLSLTPISIDANLTNALSRQNIRVDVPCRFTVGISTEPDSMNNAAERLLGLTAEEIQELARDILFGQLRLVIATMSIEEALGKEAAAKAINEAKVSVAEQDRNGEIGKAEAVKETRIRTSQANAVAVQGENNAKVEIANSDAFRREKEAEANRLAVTAEKVQQAKALQDAYIAERDAENARAERERSTQQANILVAQQVEKDRIIIAAEAEAEKLRVSAKGEADAIFAKMEAEAKGYYEILTKQAAGYDKMVQAAGGDAAKAFMLLMSEKMPELVKTQVEAIKGIKFDNVTVWDSGNSADGKGSTANFLSGLMKSVPPMSDLFNMAGLNLPDYLAKKKEDAPMTQAEEVKDNKKK